MKSRMTGNGFGKGNKDRKFLSSSRQNKTESKGRRSDCLIKGKDMSLNVLDRIDMIYKDESNPFIAQRVLGTAKIAMQVLSKPGKKMMADIIEEIGTVEEYNGTDVNMSLERLVKFHDNHITDCYRTFEKLDSEKYKDFYDRILKSQKAHHSFVTVHKASVYKKKMTPNVAILKIYALEHIYSMKYLDAIMKAIFEINAEQEEIKNKQQPEVEALLECITRHQEILAPQVNPIEHVVKILERSDYAFAADHGSDLALLLLASPSTTAKAALHNVIETHQSNRVFAPIHPITTLHELTTSVFITEANNCLSRSKKAPSEEFQIDNNKIPGIVDRVEAIYIKCESILLSHGYNTEVLFAKIETIDLIYQMRHLFLKHYSTQPVPTSSNHQRIPSPTQLINQKALLKPEKQRNQQTQPPAQLSPQKSRSTPAQHSFGPTPLPEQLMNQKARLKTRQQRHQQTQLPNQRIIQKRYPTTDQQSFDRIPSPVQLMNQKNRLKTEKHRNHCVMSPPTPPEKPVIPQKHKNLSPLTKNVRPETIIDKPHPTTLQTINPVKDVKEILERQNYLLAADHGCDLAMLLLESANTENKAKLKLIIEAHQSRRFYSTATVTGTLQELIAHFNKDIPDFAEDIEALPEEDSAAAFSKLMPLINTIAEITKKHTSLLDSTALSKQTHAAKLELINAAYEIRAIMHPMRLKLQRSRGVKSGQ